VQQHFTIEQASVRANRCARTIAKALADGELNGQRRGQRVYISSKQLDKWATARGISGGATPATASELLKLARDLVQEARRQRAGRKDAA
jgi:hypothetical protein